MTGLQQQAHTIPAWTAFSVQRRRKRPSTATPQDGKCTSTALWASSRWWWRSPLFLSLHVAMPRARSVSDLGGRRGVAGERLREGRNSVISRSVPEGNPQTPPPHNPAPSRGRCGAATALQNSTKSLQDGNRGLRQAGARSGLPFCVRTGTLLLGMVMVATMMLAMSTERERAANRITRPIHY